MKFDYTWTKEDIVDFYSFESKRIIYSRKQFLVFPIVGTCFFLFLGFMLVILKSPTSIVGIPVVIMGLVLSLSQRSVLVGRMKKNYKSFYDQIPDHILYGKRHLRVTDDTLVFTNDLQANEVKLAAIQSLRQSQSGIYLDLSCVFQDSTIIPHSAFQTQKEQQEFIELIKSKMTQQEA